MFVGTINKGVSIAGYIRNNCLELGSLQMRHSLLVGEMVRRGYKHKSELPKLKRDEQLWQYYLVRVDRPRALNDLLDRCPDCKKRFDIYAKKLEWLL